MEVNILRNQPGILFIYLFFGCLHRKRATLILLSSVTRWQSLWSAETCGDVNEQLRTACEAAISEAQISAQHCCRKEKRYGAQATTSGSIAPLPSPNSHKMITSIWRINKRPHYPHRLGTLSWPLWKPSLDPVCFSSAEGVFTIPRCRTKSSFLSS